MDTPPQICGNMCLRVCELIDSVEPHICARNSFHTLPPHGTHWETYQNPPTRHNTNPFRVHILQWGRKVNLNTRFSCMMCAGEPIICPIVIQSQWVWACNVLARPVADITHCSRVPHRTHSNNNLRILRIVQVMWLCSAVYRKGYVCICMHVNALCMWKPVFCRCISSAAQKEVHATFGGTTL